MARQQEAGKLSRTPPAIKRSSKENKIHYMPIDIKNQEETPEEPEGEEEEKEEEEEEEEEEIEE